MRYPDDYKGLTPKEVSFIQGIRLGLEIANHPKVLVHDVLLGYAEMFRRLSEVQWRLALSEQGEKTSRSEPEGKAS